MKIFFFVLSISFFISCSGNKSSKKQVQQKEDSLIPVSDDTGFPEADLDGDNKTDDIFFDYTGGAHCCYHMHIVLSSDSSTYDFPFYMDGGYIGGSPDNSNPDHFFIENLDQDKQYEIFMEINTYNSEKSVPDYPGYNIKTNYIVFDYNNRKLNVYDIFPYGKNPCAFLAALNSPKPVSGFYIFIDPLQKDDPSEEQKYMYSYSMDNDVTFPYITDYKRFDFITTISQNRAFVRQDNYCAMLDSFGRRLKFIPSDWKIEEIADLNINGNDFFEEDFCPIQMESVEKDGMHLTRGYRFVDTSGTPRSGFYYAAEPFHNGMAAVKPTKNDKWGFIDKNFRMVIPPKYAHIYYGFSDDTCHVALNDSVDVYIDKKGRIVKYPN